MSCFYVSDFSLHDFPFMSRHVSPDVYGFVKHFIDYAFHLPFFPERKLDLVSGLHAAPPLASLFAPSGFASGLDSAFSVLSAFSTCLSLSCLTPLSFAAETGDL